MSMTKRKRSEIKRTVKKRRLYSDYDAAIIFLFLERQHRAMSDSLKRYMSLPEAAQTLPMIAGAIKYRLHFLAACKKMMSDISQNRKPEHVENIRRMLEVRKSCLLQIS